jgi:hypothetical protein
MLEFFKRLWIGWNGVARGILTAQNWVAMTFAWIVGLAPVALAMRVAGVDLLDRRPLSEKRASHWRARTDGPLDMKRAQRMF